MKVKEGDQMTTENIAATCAAADPAMKPVCFSGKSRSTENVDCIAIMGDMRVTCDKEFLQGSGGRASLELIRNVYVVAAPDNVYVNSDAGMCV